jgi:hypothetical protein
LGEQKTRQQRYPIEVKNTATAGTGRRASGSMWVTVTIVPIVVIVTMVTFVSTNR